MCTFMYTYDLCTCSFFSLCSLFPLSTVFKQMKEYSLLGGRARHDKSWLTSAGHA